MILPIGHFLTGNTARDSFGSNLRQLASGIGKFAMGPLGGIAISGIQALMQRRWNERMWDKMNRYNTPTAQMDRFRKAGLNPNLIYQGGNAGNAGQVTGYQQPSNSNIPAHSLAHSQLGIAEAQTNMLEKQSTFLEQQAFSEEYKRYGIVAKAMADMASGEKMNAETKKLYAFMWDDLQFLRSQTRSNEATTAHKYADIGRIDQQIKLLEQQRYLVKEQTAHEWAKSLQTKMQTGKLYWDKEMQKIHVQFAKENPGMKLDDGTLYKYIRQVLEGIYGAGNKVVKDWDKYYNMYGRPGKLDQMEKDFEKSQYNMDNWYK